MRTLRSRSAVVSVAALLTVAQVARADEAGVFNLGARLGAGGRYDDVRMCVASPPGVKGGPAADLSFFFQVPLAARVSLDVDVPVMRPILFGAAFKMLQFEPSASLRFRHEMQGPADVLFGPTLGVSLNYGPDYRSAPSGAGRTPSFFSMGPIIGGYVGFNFKNPGKRVNFELGLTPYVIPLFGLNDPANHRGVVVGGLIDLSMHLTP